MLVINDFDRPCKEFLVETTTGEYLYKKGFKFTNFSEATTLEEFGFTLSHNLDKTICELTYPSTAKYKDGKPKVWQGESYFEVVS